MLLARLLLAVAVSVAVILSAPFNRELRNWVRSTFPGHFVLVVGAAVALAIVLAVAVAIFRIRNRRGMRYTAIAVSIVLGVSYALANAQGIPEADVVERVHFVEYGLITFLFYRAWRPSGDASLFVLPVLAALLVGTAEEWLQWFIPGRVGDMRDVFLNGAAIVCGVLFSFGVDPPETVSLRLHRGSLRRIGLAFAAVALVFAAFVYTVHVGVENRDAETGTFRSLYDAATLVRLGQERAVQWKAQPPIARPKGMSREDQYQSEGHLHVHERNRRWEAGDIRGAWYENLILEKFYAPVLDTPSFLDKAGHRWPEAQRADAQQRSEAARAAITAPYESLADVAEGRHFIRLWSPVVFWSTVFFLIAAVVGATFAIDRGR